MTRSRDLVLALVVLVVPAAARAQGSFSTEGLGYPPGQLSTRSLGMGGGLGEMDPLSPLNPAALAGLGGTTLYAQYDPEFRTVNTGSATSRTTTSRFPVFALASRLGERTVLGLSISTLIDRSWGSVTQDTVTIQDVATPRAITQTMTGAIEDVRVGLAYDLTRGIDVGIGAHLITGNARDQLSYTFPTRTDTLLGVASTSDVDYSGLGISAGLAWRPLQQLMIAGSGMLGGALDRRAGTTSLSSARVPDRFGAGVRFDGIPGASLSASYDWTQWSKLAGLSSAASTARDGSAIAAGVELAGPRVGERALELRLGGRLRDLPFSEPDASRAVREHAFDAGLGVPFAFGRSMLDFAVQRATRVGSTTGVDESAWTVSLGLTLHP